MQQRLSAIKRENAVHIPVFLRLLNLTYIWHVQHHPGYLKQVKYKRKPASLLRILGILEIPVVWNLQLPKPAKYYRLIIRSTISTQQIFSQNVASGSKRMFIILFCSWKISMLYRYFIGSSHPELPR